MEFSYLKSFSSADARNTIKPHFVVSDVEVISKCEQLNVTTSIAIELKCDWAVI